MDIWDIVGTIVIYIIAALTLGTPVALSVWNIVILIKKNPKGSVVSLFLTTFVGLFEYFMLYIFCFAPAGDWNEQILVSEVHNSVSSTYFPSVWIPIFLGYIALFALAFLPQKARTPILASVCIALVVIGNVIGIVFFIQVAPQADWEVATCFGAYHVNMLLVSAYHIRRVVRDQVREIREFREKQSPENGTQKPFYAKLFAAMDTISSFCLVAFSFVLPVAAILYIFLLLIGQGPAGIVKAFTDTADWTFSQQIPPPPLEYDGHYLCTVAAGGHKKIVKPLRLGTRRGAIIVVNRQLQVANAFEDLIQERAPRFHKWVRHFYDTHGYPLSKIITTPLRADVVYILMKPLEWVFLFTLYLFDCKPEERIARQYL